MPETMWQIIYYLIILILIIKLGLKCSYKRCNSKISLLGKTAIITGGNKGIGFQTSLGLASRGCKVIIACRSNAEKQIQEIKKMTNNNQISYKHLDLGSLKSVRKFSQEIHNTERKIDILINNAGMNIVDHKYTDDGLHHGMQVNLFSSVLLTYLFVDLLKESDNARVIFVSSYFAYVPFLTLETLNFPENSENSLLNSAVVYTNSKLGQALVAVEFAEKLSKFGINVNAIHPGAVRTEIYTTLGNINLKWHERLIHWIFLYVIYYFMRTPEEGAQKSLRYAMSNSCKNLSGYVDTGFNWLLGTPMPVKDKEFRKKVMQKIEILIQLQDNEKIED